MMPTLGALLSRRSRRESELMEKRDSKSEAIHLYVKGFAEVDWLALTNVNFFMRTPNIVHSLDGRSA